MLLKRDRAAGAKFCGSADFTTLAIVIVVSAKSNPAADSLIVVSLDLRIRCGLFVGGEDSMNAFIAGVVVNVKTTTTVKTKYHDMEHACFSFFFIGLLTQTIEALESV